MSPKIKHLFLSIISGIALGISWPVDGLTVLVFLSLIPLFSTIMAIFFYNEQFQFFHLIGAILIILGLFLSNKEIKNA